MNCINLKERFGDRHPVRYEESYYADHGEGARAEDPWLMIIPCRHGHLYPHGRKLLGVSTNTKGLTTTKIRELACTTVVQDSDEGVNTTFHVDDFDQVAEVMKPHRRRQWTDEQREAQRQHAEVHLAPHQFPTQVKRPPDDLERDSAGRMVQKPLDGFEAVIGRQK